MAALPLSLSYASSMQWAIVFASLCALFWTYRLVKVVIREGNCPPGPNLAFFIRNVPQMKTEHPEILLQNWAAKFGDVIYMYIPFFGKSFVILSSWDAVRELLIKRSSIYSDRPRLVGWAELMGWGWATVVLPYGPRLRKHRRFIHASLNENAIKDFTPVLEQETSVLLDSFMRFPDQFMQHFRKYSAGTIFAIAYGHTVISMDDQVVSQAVRVGELTAAEGMPGTLPVDLFPVLRYLPAWAPFAGFKRRALAIRKAVEVMLNVPFQMVKKSMRSGTATPCLVSSLLEEHCNPDEKPNAAEDEEDIKAVAGTLYGAGEDTTVAMLETFMFAMVRHPESLKKAQEEIDRVIGQERLLTINDRPFLPYLDCILKEVLRWSPPVPLGIPHRVMEDDVYKGYHIPRGATVLANIYTILQACPQPRVFRPERFMEDPGIPDPRELVFGFGRRACPGRYLAEWNAWYLIANIIATFNIRRSVDEEGKEVIPPLEFESGLIRHPKPFSCSITPRFGRAASLPHQANAYEKS